jgi:tRNA(Ile)-lysidine synthase
VPAATQTLSEKRPQARFSDRLTRVADPARRGPQAFGPPSLQRRLAELLPGFPDLAVCVAFSGGADSTALLAALTQLPQRLRAVRAVHIDHHLHPTSGRWSAHCRRVARSLGVPLRVRSATVTRSRGESLEAAARSARYALFAAELGEGEALLTAHHQDDQLETVLLQLLRGAGVAGLAAMPPLTTFARGLLVRPLLGVPRAALGAWLRSRGLTWVEDETNALTSLDRNYLRAEVLPAIRARWPGAATTVGRSARHLAEAQRLLGELGARDSGRASWGAMLSAKALRALPPDRRRNALRYWITARGHLPPPTTLLNEIAGPLLAARADAQPRVSWDGAVVQRQADLLMLCAGVLTDARAPRQAHAGATDPASPLADLTWCWQEGRAFVLPAPFGTLAVRRDARGPLDLDALAPTLTLRARRGGERLRPVRGGPRRTLKQLLQEARVPVTQRAHLPLVFDGERLIAAADLWIDESVQAHAASARRGRLVWRERH